MGNVPVPVVDDLDAFDVKFPGRALQAVNGQSIRVTGQRICRDARWENRSLTHEQLAELVLDWMRGAGKRTRALVTVERRIWVARDETEFDTKEACMEYEQSLIENN